MPAQKTNQDKQVDWSKLDCEKFHGEKTAGDKDVQGDSGGVRKAPGEDDSEAMGAPSSTHTGHLFP